MRTGIQVQAERGVPTPVKAHLQETTNLASWRGRKVTGGEKFTITCFYRAADMSGPAKFFFFPGGTPSTLQATVFGGLVVADQGRVWPHGRHLNELAAYAMRRMGQDLGGKMSMTPKRIRSSVWPSWGRKRGFRTEAPRRSQRRWEATSRDRCSGSC
jgi:hypothetical protein